MIRRALKNRNCLGEHKAVLHKRNGLWYVTGPRFQFEVKPPKRGKKKARVRILWGIRTTPKLIITLGYATGKEAWADYITDITSHQIPKYLKHPTL